MLPQSTKSLLSIASKINALPGLAALSPSAATLPKAEELRGFRAAQKQAYAAAHATAQLLQPGMTERQAATLLSQHLHDAGVRSYFHHAFAWWGTRTRFAGVKHYYDYLPTQRCLLEGEVFILDVAPIVGGFTCDIGYTGCLGENAEWERAKKFLAKLRHKIPSLFVEGRTGGAIWGEVERDILDAGYDNIHAQYPFSVLGHRVHRTSEIGGLAKFIHFGWQSYWGLLSRGLFGQLLNQNHEGSLVGLWAIEPHIGAPHFGAKFEEILVVTPERTYWLEESNPYVES